MSSRASDYWADHEWLYDYYESLTGRYYTKKCLTFIFSCLKNKTNVKQIIDIGGGNGRFARPLVQRGYRVTVLDIDPAILKKLQQEEKNIRVIHGDASDLKIEEKYDLVLCIGTIKYLEDFAKFIRQTGEILNDDGCLLIEMLNSFSVRLWIKKLLKREIFPYPTRLNPVQCNRILKTHGFKTVKRKGSFWLVPSYRNKSKLIFRCMKFIEDILFLNHIVLFSPQYFIFAQKI